MRRLEGHRLGFARYLGVGTESEASVESLLLGDPAQLFQPHDVADGPWLIREGREWAAPPQAQRFVATGDGPSRVSPASCAALAPRTSSAKRSASTEPDSTASR